MEKKRGIIIAIIFVVVIAVPIYFLLFGPGINSGSAPAQLRYVPLSQAQIEVAANAILSSDFIHAIPEKHPIALTFYSFEGEEQVVQDTFLLGKGQLLQEGTPGIYIGMHSRYIDEVAEKGLCETVKGAVNNGDVTFYSESSQASLFLKYNGMLKYRECFGI